MKRLLDWLDHRTGYRKITREALYENIPGGSRWRYVWGSTLTFTLSVQFITGIILWMCYNPSSQTAWESVYYIQYEMTGGWLLRGLHHYTAQMMIVLLALHLMQVMIDGAYKAPREVNFWFGLILLLLVLALSLTGYLLPWDQKGYWATKVTTNIVGISPVVGVLMQKLLIGGPDYGHHTLSRFFALHAGVIPALIIALLAGHIYLFRRHGITAKKPYRRPDEAFWPDQVLKDAVACLAVLATVLFLIVRHRLSDPAASLGAELSAPADPSEAYSAARPEWYFLFLFQFLKYFPGRTEIVGAIIIPTLVVLLLFALPLLGGWRPGPRWQALFAPVLRILPPAYSRLTGHGLSLAIVYGLLFGAGLLTFLAWRQDKNDPTYQAAVRQAEEQAARVRVLAQGPQGIPVSGALSLLRNDPFTEGPKIFARNCASCHRYGGHDGLGIVPTEAASAADLKGFASRAWLAGLLDPNQIAGSNYFGGTRFKTGKMARFVQRDLANLSPEKKEELRKVIAAISAEADLPVQRPLDQREQTIIEQGRLLAAGEEMRCTECHQFRKKDEDATAPDLTGYGSREWLLAFLADPAHERFYGNRNDRMPSYGKDQMLSQRDLGLVVDWLRGDWYEPPASIR